MLYHLCPSTAGCHPRHVWKQTVEDLLVHDHLRLMLLLKETMQVACAYLHP